MRLFPLSSSSSREQRNGGNNRALLYLNVYDLTPINNYLYWFGLGIFHSGIEVHGLEYGFGAHEYPTSGVFEVEPKSCPGFVFRRSVLLGSTDMSRSEFRSFMEHISGKFHGDTYHLIAKNCNHFTDEVCIRLTGKHIPGWVNRLARLGNLASPKGHMNRISYHILILPQKWVKRFFLQLSIARKYSSYSNQTFTQPSTIF